MSVDGLRKAVCATQLHTAVQLYKVRPLRATARDRGGRGGAGHMTVVETRAVHG